MLGIPQVALWEPRVTGESEKAFHGIKIPECSRKCQMQDQVGPASGENHSRMWARLLSNLAGTGHEAKSALLKYFTRTPG